ncbi:MAG: hypothetical protein JO257_04550 [Deltaproteobacteria bacterium]|nr:hypothetical protein [Deltaproteobacteria bacterium]
MTAPIAEQPEDVRTRPAAVTLLVVIAAIAACAVIVWLLVPARRSPAIAAPTMPAHEPYDHASALELRRAAQARAIDAWLPAAIDRYVGGAR